MPMGSHSEKRPGTLTPGIHCPNSFAFLPLKSMLPPSGFSHSCDSLQLSEYPNLSHHLTLHCAARVLLQSPHLIGHKPMTSHRCWRKAQTGGVGTQDCYGTASAWVSSFPLPPSLSHAPTVSPALSGFQMLSCTNSSQVSCIH